MTRPSLLAAAVYAQVHAWAAKVLCGAISWRETHVMHCQKLKKYIGMMEQHHVNNIVVEVLVGHGIMNYLSRGMEQNVWDILLIFQIVNRDSHLL
jgi:hypothetical protein